MTPTLAYAEPASSSSDNLEIVMISLGVIAISCVLAFVPLALCWARHHRQTETVMAAAVLWGVVTAGSIIFAISAQMKWSHERLLRIESGYYDPQDQSDAPAKPFTIWGALAIAYGGLIAWAASQKNPPPPALPFAARLKAGEGGDRPSDTKR
jgi:uncharacterized membrane protein